MNIDIECHHGRPTGMCHRGKRRVTSRARRRPSLRRHLSCGVHSRDRHPSRSRRATRSGRWNPGAKPERADRHRCRARYWRRGGQYSISDEPPPRGHAPGSADIYRSARTRHAPGIRGGRHSGHACAVGRSHRAYARAIARQAPRAPRALFGAPTISGSGRVPENVSCVVSVADVSVTGPIARVFARLPTRSVWRRYPAELMHRCFEWTQTPPVLDCRGAARTALDARRRQPPSPR
jgi:hypothetical protein